MGELIHDAWAEELCPPPRPTPSRFAPGFAITGLRGYLEIGGQQTVDIPCLGETIVATARYEVRWGDDDVTTTDSRGGPWPDGDVTHVYTDVADTEIVVEAYWSGSWNGTDLGEIPVPTTDTIPLEVQEVQAVRQR